MMTLDDAFQAASLLLVQRGQLLNGHLLRLVDSDKELFREVRQRLIATGVAEDRSGVGLALSAAVPTLQSRGISDVGMGQLPTSVPQTGGDVHGARIESPATDWWLMMAGAVQGPLDLAFLVEMCRKGDVEPGHVVRHGQRGLWKPLDSVPELAAARRGLDAESTERLKEKYVQPSMRSRSDGEALRAADSLASGANTFTPIILPNEQITGTSGQAGKSAESNTAPVKEEFVFPARNWSIRRQRGPNPILRGWKRAADLIGSSTRLTALLVALTVIGIGYEWWRLPPSRASILQEFTACSKVMTRLRDKKAGRDDWSEMEQWHRPQIEAIASRLKPYATSKYPAEQSLYLAATQGLLPMLEYSGDWGRASQNYDLHMAAAEKAMSR